MKEKTVSSAKRPGRRAVSPTTRSTTVRRVSSRSRTTSTARTPPTHSQIAERAYYLSLERAGNSDPVADWLRAEQELTAARSNASTRRPAAAS